MSVLIAIKEKNRIVVGVDVRMSSDDSYIDSYARRPKAIHITKNNDVIVGAVGNVGLLDIFKELMLSFKTEDLYSMDRAFIVKYVIPPLVSEISRYVTDDNRNSMDATFLLAIKDRAYIIPGNYSVSEIIDYEAVGSGRDVASGSLHTSAKFGMSSEERIMLAIEAAGTLNNSVSKVSYIGDTKGKRFTPSNA